MTRPAAPRVAAGTAPSGFTLLELLIATAIFSILGLAVVYLMRQGMNVFTVGTTDSAVQDRADTVLPKVRKDVLAIHIGDSFDPPPLPPKADDLGMGRKEPPKPPPVVIRLRAGYVRLKDLPPELKETDCPYVAFVIAMADEWRDALLRRDVPPGVQPKEYVPEEVNAPTRDAAVFQPAGGLLEVCWIAVPGDPPEGQAADPVSILTLRRGFRAPIGGEGSLLDPTNLDSLEKVRKRCPVEERGVLHFSALWRNAFAASWDESLAGGPGVDDTDPYVGAVWDSTRALDRTFRMARGPESLYDPSDDRFPSAVRLEVTLASTSARGYSPETFLAEAVDAQSTQVRVLDANPLLAFRARGENETRWVKIDGEWMTYRVTSTSPDALTGLVQLERAKRGTKAATHVAGAPVFLGTPYRQEVRLRMSRDAYARKEAGRGR